MARTLLSAPPTDRVGRYPKHTFSLEEYPYTAQPFLIAPVLPGETVQNIKFEARVVSDPVVSPLIGWKKEYYFFYVRMTDLLSDTIRDMFVDPANVDLAATLGIPSNDLAFYTAKGGVDYTARCLQSVWQHYFADQDDVFADYNIGNGIPRVQIRDRFWLDSITDDDLMPEGADVSDATSAEQLEAMMAAYEQLRALGIANMTYEDFLRSYGITIPGAQEHKPELLARFSDFQYPSNTINPSNGTPTSALSWVFNNSSRDPKFIKEPGFILGVSISRPKVYFAGLAGSLASHLTRAWDWVPNYLNEGSADPMPFTSLKRFDADTGPLGDRTTATDEYWIDMRDLFIHGDQFQNRSAFAGVPVDVPTINGVALPPADNAQNSKYPASASLTSFFVGGAGRVRSDGYASFAIKGMQVDYTVGNIASL